MSRCWYCNHFCSSPVIKDKRGLLHLDCYDALNRVALYRKNLLFIDNTEEVIINRDFNCINDQEFRLLEFIYNYKLTREKEPTQREIASYLKIDINKIIYIIRKLVSKNFLLYNSFRGGSKAEKYQFIVDYKSIPLC